MKKIILLAIIALFITPSFSQIKFEKGTLNDIFERAKSENKIVMVDVMTDWCKWCIELDNKVYSNKEVADFANTNQVNYKIDAEKGEGIDFAKKYNVKGFPTVLFLKPTGEEIDRVYGYVPLKDFNEMMRDYNKGINTQQYLKELLVMEPNNIEANLKLADKESSLGEIESAKARLKTIIEIDPENKSGKTDDAKYKLAASSDEKTIVNNLETFINENPNSDVLNDAYISLSEAYAYTAKDKDKAEKCYKRTLELYPDYDAARSSYGQYLNGVAIGLADKKDATEEEYKQGLALIDQAIPYVTGSVNEASSYYIQSKLLFNLKDYAKANESIDKALKIFDRKLYRDHKEKVEKQLSSK
jgi:thioredoxin-related protein